ncbi:hypothetical protein ACWEU6_07070 [Streptosporangium sandarakinum]|uniref:hypothetical protein n=1 Tax=Streptosporangium sandarakinum TaxID=1260955 RepID=UPI003689F4F9
MSHDTAPEWVAIELTPKRRMDLMRAISRAYPPYAIWWSAGVYYATTPTPGGGDHTLHDVNAGDLCKQLARVLGREGVEL